MSMRATLGRRLWAEMHAYAWRYPRDPSAQDRQAARAWLAAFAQLLPGHSCSCRWEYHSLLEASPPNLDTPEDFYWWTVALHDRINAKLDKPLHAPTWSPHQPIFLVTLS